jgi:hypothetical protein
MIGGITRMAFGELSVHRSGVDSNSPTTLEKLQKRNDNNTKEVNDYVEEMGISPLLADAILMTPNWRTRELTWRGPQSGTNPPSRLGRPIPNQLISFELQSLSFVVELSQFHGLHPLDQPTDAIYAYQ